MNASPILFGLLLLLLPEAAQAGHEPEPICTREDVVDYVAREIHRRAPYAVMRRETIGERPGREPAIVQCAVTVVQRDFDYVKYRTETWAEYQGYTVRWLNPGYEVTVPDPIRQKRP
jgi:hypothetical protein